MTSQQSAARTRGSGVALVMAFSAVVGSFVATNLIVQQSSARVGTLASDITDNSAPSIERLALVRRSVLESEIALSRFVHEPQDRAAAGRTLDAELTRLRDRTRGYLRLPLVAGEQPLRIELEEGWLRFESAAMRTRDSAASGATDDAARLLGGTVEPARQHVLEQVSQATEVNAAGGRQLATEIRAIRHRTTILAVAFDSVCAVMAVIAAALLHRQLRSRRALVDTQLALLEERAAEMERFAGRVAHDIRNPLQAAHLAANLATRKSSEEPVRELVGRVVRSLSRADAITSGLLEFARSGSKPEPGARTHAAAVIDDVIAGMSPEATRSGIELRAEPVAPVLLACSEGVYLSLVGNLVRNAMKYMGDGPTRRITVRVSGDGPLVRTEVTDTGPGISPASLPSLFEPYFRLKRSGGDGLGLGLATVKKLAESHGGRVGVHSELGRGSTFWFEMPRAGVTSDVLTSNEGGTIADARRPLGSNARM